MNMNSRRPRSRLTLAVDAALSTLSGRYHETYRDTLGWKQSSGASFNCWNKVGHEGGVDSHPSLSVDNETGRHHCHCPTCDISGNLQSYWSRYLKGRGRWSDYFPEFVWQITGDAQLRAELDRRKTMSIPVSNIDNAGAQEVWAHVEQKKKTISEQDQQNLDSLMQSWCDALQQNPEALKYLKDARGADPETAQRLHVGLSPKGHIAFFQVRGDGHVCNVKTRDPNGKPGREWQYPIPGLQQVPYPYESLSCGRLVFTEGEWDCIALSAAGVKGVLTLGGASCTDILKRLTQDEAERYFTGKEVIIVPDDDDAGERFGVELARSLVPFTENIKIVDLRKRPDFPEGLDPTVFVGGSPADAADTTNSGEGR